jgi:hypothetical protein
VRAALLLLAVALLPSGCGSNATSGSRSSKQHPLTPGQTRDLFVSTCGSCQADREDVRRQIRTGGGGMPQGLLQGADADSVADYVAAVAGK